jgi:hypothetical protein
MVRPCPECGEPQVDLEPAAEMSSRPTLYDCRPCALRFEVDASGVLFEVDP